MSGYPQSPDGSSTDNHPLRLGLYPSESLETLFQRLDLLQQVRTMDYNPLDFLGDMDQEDRSDEHLPDEDDLTEDILSNLSPERRRLVEEAMARAQGQSRFHGRRAGQARRGGMRDAFRPGREELRRDAEGSVMSWNRSRDPEDSHSQRTVPSTLTMSSDLDEMIQNGQHVNAREGIARFTSVPSIFRSAVLFEATRTHPTSLTTEIRYLPLANAFDLGTAIAPPSFAENSRVALAYMATNQVLSTRCVDVLTRTKREIDFTRKRRSLYGPSPGNNRPQLNGADHGNDMSLVFNSPTPRTGHWPANRVPLEIFEMISSHLSPRDIRNMRLVTREFDRKCSPTLFNETVVPFTGELYDMVEDDVSARHGGPGYKGKGKGKAVDVPDLASSHGDSMYYRTSNDRPKHGLRVFQGFGPHMVKFGLRFEVTEAELALAPAKKITNKHVESYHGEYDWPPPGYPRFNKLANLEQTADETPRMTAALATLKNVREIGLCIDSGLGYLNGPDLSHYDTLLDKPLPIFEGSSPGQSSWANSAEKFWSCVRDSHESLSGPSELAQQRLMTSVLLPSIDKLPPVQDGHYADSTEWFSFTATGLFGAKFNTPSRGVFFTAEEHHRPNEPIPSPPLSPARISSEQKQWLLETGWAQSAFLDTYVLALADNPQIFHQVTKLTITKLSSGLLAKIGHGPFWEALPYVNDVTLLVSPEWRTVGKDDAGFAEVADFEPSIAASIFHAVVARMSQNKTIKKLRIGYTDGGENAKGIFGRNRHLMPAPVALFGLALNPHPPVLSFDHVEDLTLVNCWITPNALMLLARQSLSVEPGSKSLTLDSVSLTANIDPHEHLLAFRLQLVPNWGPIHNFRAGSWPNIVNDLRRRVLHPTKPDLDPPSNPLEGYVAAPEPIPTPFHKIQLISCGYTILNHAENFDQSAIDRGEFQGPNGTVDLTARMAAWFRTRAEFLRTHMMDSQDKLLGRIVPHMDPNEMNALSRLGMRLGWQSAKELQAEYDGQPEGGSGRFGGLL